MSTVPPNEDDSDLSFFVSRPDIRAPKITVKTYDEDATSPGYIFTAPYYRLHHKPNDALYSPAQIGPHIYDKDGALIWSGAELSNNSVVTDFRPITIDGEIHLSFILQESRDRGDNTGKRRTGLVLNSSFDTVRSVDMTRSGDPHEFLPVNNATSFLRVLHRLTMVDHLVDGERIRIQDTCAAEVDVNGNDLFTFCASEKLGVNETYVPRPTDEVLRRNPWDLFHMNSVAKFSNGDYLISIRFTNTIYRVSHVTGEVVWRLGGKFSDFEQDFNFSMQHDARIISEDDGVVFITFFDNASADKVDVQYTAVASSLKVIALYENGHGGSRKLAELQRIFPRPDGALTTFRGNGQYYPSGGAFACWSAQGYVSEFAPDGHVVQEAMFESDRWGTYRAYKSKFIGMPSSLPTLKTFGSLNNANGVSLISYVSWNGATEVASWEFFGSNDKDSEFESLGQTPKTGFETTFVTSGSWKYTRVQAKDIAGNVLRQSCSVWTNTPVQIDVGALHANSSVNRELADQFSVAFLWSSAMVMSAIVIALVIRYKGSTLLYRQIKRAVFSSYSDRHGYVAIKQEGVTQV